MKPIHKFLAFYSLPLLVVLVACFQLFKTETSNLSRWKGAGFGMYTNINEVHNIILVNDTVFTYELFKPMDNIQKHRVKSNLLYNPNNKTAKKFIRSLKNEHEVKSLQIYRPVVDVSNNQLSYTLAYEQLFDKN